MIRTLLLCSLLAATTLLAQAPPAEPASPAPAAPAAALPADPRAEQLATDLRALSRIADLSKNLGDTRQVVLAIVDSDIEALRERRADETYRWASLQREESARVKDEKTIEKVQTEKVLREVTITAPNAYRVEVVVPQKRNLVQANNRVYVRNIVAESTGFDGKVTRQEIPVNAWVEPGNSHGVALTEIGKSVMAVAELGVESGNKRAVAEVALIQAKLVDDPTSPWFSAVKRLLQIREVAAAKDINRGMLKTTVDEALLALPGELDKRAAEQAAAAEHRKQLMATGELSATIAVGDATPDVVAAIQEAARLLGGTLDDQALARTKLQSLIEMLTPKAPEPTVAPVGVN
ncbi:MAG: hypothetical protein WA208_19320 [Thermoanaerobaculia bacterium]